MEMFITNEKRAALKRLADFVPRQQLRTLWNNATTDDCEEHEFFSEKLLELAKTVTEMPKTYEQEGKGDLAVVYLHYFGPSCDFWITEKDMGADDGDTQQHQAFGFSEIQHDGGELGYISIAELIATRGIELDFYWTPTTLADIKAKRAA